jgi:trimeric autotransporter adhesin
MKVLIRMMAPFLFFAPLSFYCCAQSGIITTYVDLGIPKDGAPAAAWSFDFPTSVLPDGAGGFYFSSSLQNRIYHVAADGRLRLIAGNGYSGYGGDGGKATSAQLRIPAGIALDSTGNLYIADRDNNRIRKVTPDGIITTVAGNGTDGYGSTIGDGGKATSAPVYNPTGVAVDSAGNLYIADSKNNRIRKVTPEGIITTVAGGASAKLPFKVNPDGKVIPLVEDEESARARSYDRSKAYGDGGKATSAQVTGSTDVAVDSAGNLYIAEEWRVRKVTRDGVINTIAGTGDFRRGPFYFPYHGDGGKATSAEISVRGIAVDSAGNLYIADYYHSLIHKVIPDGIITIVAGTDKNGFRGDGGKAASAQLSEPGDVAIDSSGNIYVADSKNNRIRKIAPDGVITTVAGNGARPTKPGNISLDSAGNLYIADKANYSIHKVTPAGEITTVAGNGEQGSSGDGGPATSARLAYPEGLAVDSTGNLYIAEGNIPSHIRKVSPAGVITSISVTRAAVITESVAVDSTGILYIGNAIGIQKVAPNGTITTIATSGNLEESGAPPGLFGGVKAAQLITPSGITLDSSGNLYIVDKAAHRIHKITPQIIISTVAGNGINGFGGDGGKAVTAQLSAPSAVAADSAGNLYIADCGNRRIRKVTPDGMITTVAGNGEQGLAGDGGPAASAQLMTPSGIAVDSAGNLYIADSTGNCVRKVTLKSR